MIVGWLDVVTDRVLSMAWCGDDLNVHIGDMKGSGFIGSDYIAAGFLFEALDPCGVVEGMVCGQNVS